MNDAKDKMIEKLKFGELTDGTWKPMRKPPLAMAVDPLIQTVRKVYRASKQSRFDRLIKERSKWSRKRTIASNKLEEVNQAIAEFLQEMIVIQAERKSQ